MVRILCCICGCGPSAEDGGSALFIDGKDEEDRPLRYCAECLRPSVMQARLDRHFKTGPLLEPAVLSIFTQRLGAQS